MPQRKVKEFVKVLISHKKKQKNNCKLFSFATFVEKTVYICQGLKKKKTYWALQNILYATNHF